MWSILPWDLPSQNRPLLQGAFPDTRPSSRMMWSKSRICQSRWSARTSHSRTGSSTHSSQECIEFQFWGRLCRYLEVTCYMFTYTRIRIMRYTFIEVRIETFTQHFIRNASSEISTSLDFSVSYERCCVYTSIRLVSLQNYIRTTIFVKITYCDLSAPKLGWPPFQQHQLANMQPAG